MAASSKRHAARLALRMGCDGDGRLRAAALEAELDSGAYATWGAAVARHLSLHAAGPYRWPALRSGVRAYLTNAPPAGPFRGSGCPQAAFAREALIDDLAERCGRDRLQFRLDNALRPGDAIAGGQVMDESTGLVPCLEALEPHWRAALAAAAEANAPAAATDGHHRRGVGIACGWYGSAANTVAAPVTARLALAADGALTLMSGAAESGQGSDTAMVQICADALGVAMDRVAFVSTDDAMTSRGTLVTGKAAELAALDLRAKLLGLAGAGGDAGLVFEGATVRLREGGPRHEIDLASLAADASGTVLVGEGAVDPPGVAPYIAYGFAAQIAVIEVDIELGTVRVRHLVAAQDVGRAINPTLLEGQIQGAITQGLGFALMEEYVPGRSETLRDYLIPTVGDVPEIEVILIEAPTPHGPFGAKAAGEAALIPTAPAILGAIRHATGARLLRLPALPHRVLEAIQVAGEAGGAGP
jgi:CO/xanthine dehydrogenase Mo-binding subunit